MPKIFKQNKFALLFANTLLIAIWIYLLSFIKNLIINDNAAFYIYKLSDLATYLPPVWITYYLWIVRKGLK